MTTNYNYRPFPPGVVATMNGTTGVIDSSLQNLNGGSLRNSKSTELFTQSVNGGNFSTPAVSLESDNFRPAQLESLGTVFLTDEGGYLALDNSDLFFSVGDLVIADSELYPGFYRVTSIAGDVAVTDGVYVSLEDMNVWKVIGEIAGNDNGEFLITSRDTVEQISNHRKSHYLKSLRTVRTATAIRDGHWNELTGEFDTPPTEANDFASMDIDGSNEPDNTRKDAGTYGLQSSFAMATQSSPITGQYEAP